MKKFRELRNSKTVSKILVAVNIILLILVRIYLYIDSPFLERETILYIFLTLIVLVIVTNIIFFNYKCKVRTTVAILTTGIILLLTALFFYTASHMV